MKEDIKFKALKEILYGAGISFILGMIGYVLGFFTKLIAARHFGPSDLGLYEMVVTIVSVLLVISGFGLSSGLKRYIPLYYVKKQYSEIRGLLNFSFKIQLIVSIFISILIYFLSPLLTSLFNFDNTFTLLLRIISFFIPFAVVNNYFRSALLARKKIFHTKFSENILKLGLMFLGILLIFFLNLNLIWYVIFLGSTYLINTIYLFIIYKKVYINFKVKPIYKNKEWFYFSLPLLFTGILAFFMNWTDNFMLGYYLDSSDLGVYSVSFALASYVIFFPSLVQSMIGPVLTELFAKDNNLFQQIFFKVKSWIFIASAFVSLPIIIFSREILLILFGKEFVIGQNVLIVLSILLMLSTYFLFNGLVLVLNKKTKWILYNTIVFLIINIILNIILIPLLGILGAGISTGLSMGLLRFGEFILSRRYLKFTKQYVYTLKIFLILPLSLILLYYLRKFLINLQLNIILSMILICIIYLIFFVLLLFYLKIVDKDDIKLMLIVEKKIGIDLGFVKKILKRFV